jgi:hypothetical protein
MDFLKNVRRLKISNFLGPIRLIDLICVMKHLEELLLIDQLISSANELARVFASCPKISRLCVSFALNPLIQHDVRINQLRSGFQRPKFFSTSIHLLVL